MLDAGEFIFNLTATQFSPGVHDGTALSEGGIGLMEPRQCLVFVLKHVDGLFPYLKESDSSFPNVTSKCTMKTVGDEPLETLGADAQQIGDLSSRRPQGTRKMRDDTHVDACLDGGNQGIGVVLTNVLTDLAHGGMTLTRAHGNRGAYMVGHSGGSILGKRRGPTPRC